jgi:hypothetical protein
MKSGCIQIKYIRYSLAKIQNIYIYVYVILTYILWRSYLCKHLSCFFSGYLCMCRDLHVTIFPPLDIAHDRLFDWCVQQIHPKKTCHSSHSLRFFSEAMDWQYEHIWTCFWKPPINRCGQSCPGLTHRCQDPCRLNPCESGLRNQLLYPSKKKPIGLQNLFATNIHPENDNSVTDHGNFEIAKHFTGLG